MKNTGIRFAMGDGTVIVQQSGDQALRIHSLVAAALGIPVRNASVCIDLLDSGASVPFIARYRKEATGSLDDAVIFSLASHLDRIRKMEERRDFIFQKISESGHLTPDLATRIQTAATLAELDDLYLPYKPRRKTRADKAREQGLSPLADRILSQKPGIDPLREAEQFISNENGIHSASEALLGAEDIIAGTISEDPGIRRQVRELFHRSARIAASAARGTGGNAGKWADYVDLNEPVSRIPSHRILALFRGEEENLLSVKISPDTDSAVRLIDAAYVTGSGPASECVSDAVRDSYHRLIAPSLEREIRNELKERADEEAIRVFASNLRVLLMSPPIGHKAILAIDPGFRTGCKIVALNTVGDPVGCATIYPHEPKTDIQGAARTIREFCTRYRIEVIAIGDGTAGRETWNFIQDLDLPCSISLVSVPEQGASIYSASELARSELPGMDVTMRGAVSIGRRLLDPLAEMVKIEPRSIGVGQYQHDVDQTLLRGRLDEVVRSVVNEVGVDLNSASPSLLSYVSGLNPRLADAIVAYREKKGRFSNREELRQVKGIGDRTYEQAAGFLRIRDGVDPLDNTGVHPERYQLVCRMAASIGTTPRDLIGNESLVRQIDLSSFESEGCGIPTLTDIINDLVRPGRDPRGIYEPPVYAETVRSFEDLKEGIELEGIITNVTNFGAFVNIGIHENGLVHVSEMADRFVSDPSEVVCIHQRIRVIVIGLDPQRGRISLSMKQVAGR